MIISHNAIKALANSGDERAKRALVTWERLENSPAKPKVRGEYIPTTNRIVITLTDSV
jgi:hypothetical protein